MSLGSGVMTSHSNDEGFTFFEHTADIGIRASAATIQELLVQMARGLRELLAEDSPVRPQEQRTLRLAAEDADLLLLKWLQELLFWFSTDRFLPAEFVFQQATPTSVVALVHGSRFDPSRDTQGREVKAITRHQLDVRQAEGRWHGQVIVDI